MNQIDFNDWIDASMNGELMVGDAEVILECKGLMMKDEIAYMT